MEIENNSFLDYNTNSGGTVREDYHEQHNANEKKKDYNMLTDFNHDGQLEIYFTVNFDRRHPIFKEDE